MSKKRVLTGVTTTGIPHLGNYVGAIRPAIRAATRFQYRIILFFWPTITASSNVMSQK